MDVMVQIAIISGLFSLLAIIALTMSWNFKINKTVQIEELQNQRIELNKRWDLKIAKAKDVKTSKRLPKGYRNQWIEILDLLGEDGVKMLIDKITGAESVPEGNKLLDVLAPLAEGFLSNLQTGNTQIDAPKDTY